MDNAFNFSLTHKLNRIKALIDEGKITEARYMFSVHYISKLSRVPNELRYSKVLELISFASKITNKLYNEFLDKLIYIPIGAFKLCDKVIQVNYDIINKSFNNAQVTRDKNIYIIRMGDADPIKYVHEISHIINNDEFQSIIASHRVSNLDLHDTVSGQIIEAMIDIESIPLAKKLLNKVITEADIITNLDKNSEVSSSLMESEPTRYKILLEAYKARLLTDKHNKLKLPDKLISYEGSLEDTIYYMNKCNSGSDKNILSLLNL